MMPRSAYLRRVFWCISRSAAAFFPGRYFIFRIKGHLSVYVNVLPSSFWPPETGNQFESGHSWQTSGSSLARGLLDESPPWLKCDCPDYLQVNGTESPGGLCHLPPGPDREQSISQQGNYHQPAPTRPVPFSVSASLGLFAALRIKSCIFRIGPPVAWRDGESTELSATGDGWVSGVAWADLPWTGGPGASAAIAVAPGRPATGRESWRLERPPLSIGLYHRVGPFLRHGGLSRPGNCLGSAGKRAAAMLVTGLPRQEPARLPPTQPRVADSLH